MTIEEAQKTICQELAILPRQSAQELCEKTGVIQLMVYKALKAGVKAGSLKEEVIEEVKRYTVIDATEETTDVDQADEESIPVEKPKAEEKQQRIPVPTAGRDTTKFIFNNQPYSKSGCVLAVLMDYVKNKQPTFEQVKEAFPDSIVGRFGVVNKLNGEGGAKELSPDRPRYFMKDDQLLKTSDGVFIAVCNQWTLQRFVDFMEAAAKVGMKIKPE
jgi:hypothetical protein